MYALQACEHSAFPSLRPLSLDAPPARAGEQYVDPSTGIPFARLLRSPLAPHSALISAQGPLLELVGTGVRTVSFLGIRVYTVGFYVEKRQLDLIRQGRASHGWQGYEPQRLLAATTTSEGGERADGDALVGALIAPSTSSERTQSTGLGAQVAVQIVPLRSTSLTHLRDGFARAILGRLGAPSAAGSAQDDEGAFNSLTMLKSFFPARPLAKGTPLSVFGDPSSGALAFYVSPPAPSSSDLEPEHLGTVVAPRAMRELFLSYFSTPEPSAGKKKPPAISAELQQSCSQGFAKELP